MEPGIPSDLETRSSSLYGLLPERVIDLTYTVQVWLLTWLISKGIKIHSITITQFVIFPGVSCYTVGVKLELWLLGDAAVYIHHNHKSWI